MNTDENKKTNKPDQEQMLKTTRKEEKKRIGA